MILMITSPPHELSCVVDFNTTKKKTVQHFKMMTRLKKRAIRYKKSDKN